MSDNPLKTYNSVLKSDFHSFVHRSFCELNPNAEYKWNWHIEILVQALQDCMDGKIKRLIINLPPRSLKSHAASIALPAFWLGHYPSTQIICASYGQDLSDKHARDCRQVMQSAFYKRLFGSILSPDKMAVGEFATKEGGFRLATSVGGVLTGRGGDVLIIDDPLKPEDAFSDTQRQKTNDWNDNTLRTRLNDKVNGCIIAIMQRLHEDDLVGHFLKHEDWKVISFPAIAEEETVDTVSNVLGNVTFRRSPGGILHPDRDPKGVLDVLRRGMGEYNFAAQYQQNPIPPGGAVIKRDWITFYKPSELPESGYYVQSWDTAIKAKELNDYSVCTTWRVVGDKFYLVDVFRRRMEYPDLKRAVRAHYERYHPTHVLIEDKASGCQLIQDLQSEGMRSIIAYEPKNVEKEMRVHAKTAVFENGRVLLPKEAPWLADYLRELLGYPGVKHDDQVDSTIQMLDRFDRNKNIWDVLRENPKAMENFVGGMVPQEGWAEYWRRSSWRY